LQKIIKSNRIESRPNTMSLPPNMSFYPGQAFFANPYAVAAADSVASPASIVVAAVKEKPTKRACSVVGCTNGIVQGGLCVSHGAKRRKCQFPGCDKSSKAAGMCSKHGPRRDPCDEEGCTSISVRGTKCKLHAEPSKKCAVGGCRKGSVIGGMCKRHQDQVKMSGLFPGEALVSFPMPVPTCYPTGTLSQAIAQQSMLASMGMAGHPFMYPPMVAPYARGFAPLAPGMAGFGYEGSMYASQRRTIDNLTTDAMMMLELAKRSREMSDKKLKSLPSSQ
jgi:hypothetical protein